MKRNKSIPTLPSWLLATICLLLLLLAACGPASQARMPETAWQASDLRTLEAPNTSNPALDLIAGYARITPADLELRFDFFGSPDPQAYDLYLVLQGSRQAAERQPTNGGGFPLDAQPSLDWDLALGYPAYGLPRAFGADGRPVSVRPRIQRQQVQDAATLRLSLRELSQVSGGQDPRTMAFQVFLTKPGERHVEDSLGPLRVDGAAPDVQSSLLIAFWDSLPAATPAQALRRWDGAHTGPFGQRHGLNVLLQAADRSGVPVMLLDLKNPDSLVALDALGGLSSLQKQAQKGAITLPDVVHGDPATASTSLSFSRQAAQHFGLPTSSLFYGAINSNQPLAETTQGYTAAFAQLQDATHLRQWNNLRLIPLPGRVAANEDEVDTGGLTLATRIALLEAALSSDPGQLVVLGGSLPSSPWGDSLIAAPAFEYIAGHPWLHPLNGTDLLHFTTQPGEPDCADLLCLKDPASQDSSPNSATIRQALETAPADLFTGLAWQSYLRLTGASSDTRLQALREAALGPVVGPLLAAARWDQSPAVQADCASDLNWDGTAECVLASERFFAVLDPRGGGLLLAAARQNGQPVQLVGPRSQFALGLGDSLDWKPELGTRGDPQEIPGAFMPSVNPYRTEDWALYSADIQPGQISLTNPSTGQRKTYRLIENGLEVQVSGGQVENTQLPLALIDRSERKPGELDRYTAGAHSATSWTWSLAQSAGINITANGARLTGHSFIESRTKLKHDEDPNFGYPPGHFIPFPLAVIEIQPEGPYTLTLTVK